VAWEELAKPFWLKLVEQIKNRFEYVIWRSLLRAPPVKELANLIHFLSNQQQTETDLPESVEDRVSRLIDCLRSSRCLPVLDNGDNCAVVAGYYREGYEGYGDFKTGGESLHQSCLVLTSRENPRKWHHWKAKHYKFALVPTEWYEAVRAGNL